jgi:hypothetical protein
MNINEKFYKEMFKTWAKLNYKEPVNIQEAAKQPLWRNSLIQIGGKTIKYKEWLQAGIHNFSHLIDNNGNLASIYFIRNKYGITPKQLTYNSLIHSIPQAWTKMLKTATCSLDYAPRKNVLYKLKENTATSKK